MSGDSPTGAQIIVPSNAVGVDKKAKFTMEKTAIEASSVTYEISLKEVIDVLLAKALR